MKVTILQQSEDRSYFIHLYKNNNVLAIYIVILEITLFF